MLSMASPWARIICRITPRTKPSPHTANAGKAPATEAPFAIIQHPLWYRCALHDQNPVKGGRRKWHGGTTTPWGFRKGDSVGATKAGRPVWGYASAIQKRPNKRISLWSTTASPRAILGLKPPSLAAVDAAVGRGHAVRALLTSAITAFLPPSGIFDRTGLTAQWGNPAEFLFNPGRGRL